MSIIDGPLGFIGRIGLLIGVQSLAANLVKRGNFGERSAHLIQSTISAASSVYIIGAPPLLIAANTITNVSLDYFLPLSKEKEKARELEAQVNPLLSQYSTLSKIQNILISNKDAIAERIELTTKAIQEMKAQSLLKKTSVIAKNFFKTLAYLCTFGMTFKEPFAKTTLKKLVKHQAALTEKIAEIEKKKATLETEFKPFILAYSTLKERTNNIKTLKSICHLISTSLFIYLNNSISEPLDDTAIAAECSVAPINHTTENATTLLETFKSLAEQCPAFFDSNRYLSAESLMDVLKRTFQINTSQEGLKFCREMARKFHPDKFPEHRTIYKEVISKICDFKGFTELVKAEKET